MRIKLSVCLTVIFSIWLNLFVPFIAAQTPVNQSQTAVNGLEFRIGPAAKRAAKPQKRAPVSIENLSSAETDEIFKRLPPLPAVNEDNSAFKMRAETRKPPKTGAVVAVKFPS